MATTTWRTTIELTMASLRSSSLTASRPGRAFILGLSAALAAACGSSAPGDDTSPDRASGGSAGNGGDDDTSPADGGSGGGRSGGGGATGGSAHSGGGENLGGDTGLGGAPAGDDCDAGTWDHDADPETACVTKTACGDGEFVSDEGDATHDRNCAGCGSSSYSEGPNAAACTPWSDCAAGTRVANTPTATENRVCEDCTGDTYTAGQNESVCQTPDACAAGTVQTAPGSDTSPPTCSTCEVGTYCAGGAAPAADCAAGSWDHDENPATECAEQTHCVDGEQVEDEGDSTSDRACADCDAGTFSKGPDAEACTDWTPCDLGSAVTSAPSATADTVCDSCDAGYYCPGGLTTASACDAESYDDDADAETPCAPKTDCVAGEYVDEDGDAVTDRLCVECVSSYSTGTNAGSCTPWTVCEPGEQLAAGTASTDAVCKPDEWLKQFGTNLEDSASALRVTTNGESFAFGTTKGALPDETNQGLDDVFVEKRDSLGNVTWATQFGTTAADYAGDGAGDASGNVYYAGQTYGAFPGFTHIGGNGYADCFVTKLSSSGDALWTTQFGTAGSDSVQGVTVDGSGNLYVVGHTDGAFSGQTNLGQNDAFLGRIDSAGNVLWMHLFGTNLGDAARDVVVDASGNVYVAGYTSGLLPSQADSGGFYDSFLGKFTSAGDAVWFRQFGTVRGSEANTLALDASGNAYIAGYARIAATAQCPSDNDEVYFRKYDGNGALLLSRQFGTNCLNNASGIQVDGSGNIYLSGYVQGLLPGQTSAGGPYDGFVRRYDSAGNITFTRQFGTAGNDGATDLGVDALGSIYVSGATNGSFPTYTVGGTQDAFLAKFVP